MLESSSTARERVKEDTMKLANPLLPSLALKGITVPAYDRSLLETGVLHIGLGNFHRAHMARYWEDMLNAEFTPEWGICGAGVHPSGIAKQQLLESQDYLQTVVEQDGESATAHVLGCMVDHLPIDAAAMSTALENPKVKIVSMTVTEGGYFLNDGKFDINHPEIQQDVNNPDDPKTVFGVIVKAIRYRKENDLPLFTVLSCDNVPHNGDVAASVVKGIAHAQDQSLGEFTEDRVCFPNGMVDRITPVTTKEHTQYLHDSYGYEDDSPVFCEPFRQWVLEEKFTGGIRPALEKLDSVTFVNDVTPYELMKIRILNGGHATLCYPSALLGVQYVHESMQHPVISKFLDALERKEIIPTVTPPEGVSLYGYWETTAHRFANPILKDTIDRNCYDGASRQPKFIVPVVQDNLKAGRSVQGLATVSALWCRYCQGTLEDGSPIAPNDPQWDRLSELANKAKADPKLWLQGLPEVYGSAAQEPVFVDAFSQTLELILKSGVEAALNQYVQVNVPQEAALQ